MSTRWSYARGSHLTSTLLAFGVAWLTSGLAAAATCTWTSSSAANWTASTANWSCGALPGSADDVVFSSSGTGTCTIASSVSVNSISLSSGAGTVIQSNGVTVTIAGAFTQSAGTFTGAGSGASPISIGTNFSLSGGTFTSTSWRLLVSGGFSITGGTFNHNNGWIDLASTSSQSFATNGATFNTVYVGGGLVTYWKLDETSGTTASSSSHYGVNFSYGATAPTQSTSGGPTTIGFKDAAYLTFGGSAYASVSNTSVLEFNASQSYTLSAWVKATNLLSPNYQGVITFGRDTSAWWGLWISPGNTGSPQWLNGSAVVNASGAKVTSGWHHVVLVQDATANRQYVYVDGVDTTSGSPTAQNGSGGGTIFLGRGTATEYFTGSIDDVRVYNRALSASDISRLAAGGEPTTSLATQTLTGSPTIAGDLVLQSETFAIGSNTVRVGGNWYTYGGQLTGTGTINFNGSGSGKLIQVGAQTIPNLTVSGTGGWSISETGPVTISGTFAQSAGSFTSTAGLLNVGGAFNETGGTFNATGGRVMLTSTSNQTFATNGATFNNLIINDGMVGYWKLDEGSGSSAADSSGYGNDGTLGNSPTWINTSLPSLGFTDGAALSLNGSTNYVSLGTSNLPATNAAQSISLWANIGATTNGNLIALSNSSSAAVQIKVNGTSFGAYGWGGGTLVQTTTPSTGTWHHIAYTYDGAGNQTLYIDGIATTATATNQTGSVTTAYLGTYAPNNEMFNGSLDDVRIYNRVLTAAEVSALARGYQPATYLATQTMTGSPTVSGDLTLASGYLAMGANTISLGGNWWNYGGVLSATYWGGAAINLTGSGTTNAIRSAGQFLPSLNFTGTGKWTLADNLDVDSNATVTMTTGSLDLGARTLRTGALASGSGTLTTTGGTVVLDGTWDHTLSVTPQNNLRVEDPTEANLAGYWKFDEAQGSSARDWTGNGYTATLINGATWTASVPSTVESYNPAALSLASGSSQYADSWATTTATNAAFTACAWVNLNAASGYQTFLSIDGTNISGFYLQFSGGKGKFDFTMRSSDSTGSTLYEADATTAPSTGTWYHLCGVYTGSVARLYVNGVQQGSDVAVSSTWNATGHTIIGAAKWNGSRTDYVNGLIDDARIYNVALTAAQITQLANGRYANTGGTATLTLGSNVTANGAVNVDSGALDPGAQTLTAGGGLTVRNAGTLKLDTAGGAVALGSGTTLTVDGTLYASTASATIKSASGTYAFKVGSTATATPTLNINGLAVTHTDANGMWIDANTSAATTFTRFDNIAFSNGTSGGELLQIYATSLYLSSAGCTFDSGVTATTSYSVKLTGNGTGDGETRVVFGGSTCASNVSSCQASKSDDDANNDGIGDNSGNAAVVEFIRSVENDTAGSVIGFPTAAFDWNTFTYYSTYVAFHNASGGTQDKVYVRDETGNPLYSWTVPSAGETITGIPQWTTAGSTHYVFVATSAGKVYRLIDTGTGTSSGTLSLDTGSAWSTNPFNCSCTISTPLAMDGSNLYWGSTTSGKNFWTLGISNESNPVPVAITPVVTNTALTITSVSGTTYAFMGTVGNILKLSTAGNSLTATNSSPGSASVWGRLVAGTSSGGTQRVYAGDDGGNLWAIDPGSGFATANGLWHYNTSNAIKSSPYYDYSTDTVQYGTDGGTIIVLNGSGAALNSSYPYTPSGGAGDAITAAPLYYKGVLVVGSTGGKLYFLDRNTGTTPGVSVIKEYSFGANESVSSVGYDSKASRYMVTTANPASTDGRLYYFDLISDPTSGSL